MTTGPVRRVLGVDAAIRTLVDDLVQVPRGETIVAAVLCVLTVSGTGASRRFRWRLQAVQHAGLATTRAALFADVSNAAHRLAADEAQA
jgi:hypothetical protein